MVNNHNKYFNIMTHQCMTCCYQRGPVKESINSENKIQKTYKIIKKNSEKSLALDMRVEVTGASSLRPLSWSCFLVDPYLTPRSCL